MAEQILVYRTWNDWGYLCEHVDCCEPATEEDVVLCAACADRYEAGAEVLKVPLPRPEALAQIAHIRVGERILFDTRDFARFTAARKAVA